MGSDHGFPAETVVATTELHRETLACTLKGIVVLLLAGSIGCSSGEGTTGPARRDFAVPSTSPPAAAPRIKDPVQPPIAYGSITVLTRTSGSNVDRNGYVVQTDGPWDYTALPTAIPANGVVTLPYISEGVHSLTLLDLAPNCKGGDLDYRAVNVVAGKATKVLFYLDCT